MFDSSDIERMKTMQEASPVNLSTQMGNENEIIIMMLVLMELESHRRQMVQVKAEEPPKLTKPVQHQTWFTTRELQQSAIGPRPNNHSGVDHGDGRILAFCLFRLRRHQSSGRHALPLSPLGLNDEMLLFKGVTNL